MPIRQPQAEKKQNSLFKGYFPSLGGDVSTVARQAGVSRSRIYAALESRSLGRENARKIASYVARRLDLSGREELELRAECSRQLELREGRRLHYMLA